MHHPLPEVEDALIRPQFIVMETRSLFLSKPSLMAWIKTSFPQGRDEEEQLRCPYLPGFFMCTPDTSTFITGHVPATACMA